MEERSLGQFFSPSDWQNHIHVVLSGAVCMFIYLWLLLYIPFVFHFQPLLGFLLYFSGRSLSFRSKKDWVWSQLPPWWVPDVCDFINLYIEVFSHSNTVQHILETGHVVKIGILSPNYFSVVNEILRIYPYAYAAYFFVMFVADFFHFQD